MPIRNPGLTMRFVLIALLCLVSVVWGAVVLPEGAEVDLNEPLVQVYVVRNKTLEDGTHTNAVPPRLLLQVESVLRGTKPLQKQIEAIWLPNRDVQRKVSRSRYRHALERWDAQPLHGPPLDARLIVAGRIYDGLLHIDWRYRFPYDEELQRALEAILNKP